MWFARVLEGWHEERELCQTSKGCFGLEPLAKLPVWIASTEPGWISLQSSGAFPLTWPGLRQAPGFWEGLSEPLCPAAGTGISGRRRG